MKRVWAVLVAILLPACSGAGVDPTPSMNPDSRLIAARIGAGIADCPVTDLNVKAVAGGLPQTALECLGGTSLVNLAGLTRKPTVVNIWAQWCPPCRAESPFLRELSTELATQITWLGIDYADPRPELAIEFAGLVKWRYPHVTDMESTLRGPLQLAGIPVTLLVDQTGRIVHRHAGPFTSSQQLRDLIARHLGVS